MLMRVQVLDAAQKVLNETGLPGFTLVAICRTARLSHTSIYKHFESRDHILEALTMRWLDVIMQQLEFEADTQMLQPELAHRIFLSLLRQKCDLARQSPELHAAYSAALENNLDLKRGWTERLRALVGRIIGAEDSPDDQVMLDGLMAATRVFRHPNFIVTQPFEVLERELAGVFAIVSGHMAARGIPHRKPP